jgi:hypothetical protein
MEQAVLIVVAMFGLLVALFILRVVVFLVVFIALLTKPIWSNDP